MAERTKEKISHIVNGIHSKISELNGEDDWIIDDSIIFDEAIHILDDAYTALMSHIVNGIHSKIRGLNGEDDSVIFDEAIHILHDAYTALRLCNTEQISPDISRQYEQYEGSKNEKMVLVLESIEHYSIDLAIGLRVDDINDIVHMLNAIIRDANILLNLSKPTY